MSDADLKALIDRLTEEEQEVSYRRRVLHGRIAMLRTELVARPQKSEGRSGLEEVDVDRLANILAGKAAPPVEEGALATSTALSAACTIPTPRNNRPRGGGA